MIDVEGTYDIIVADPPWRSDFGKTSSRATERHYPTMELEDICNLQVPAANAALLFLWATSPMLAKALRVMTRWGFEYRTNLVWVKETPQQTVCHCGCGREYDAPPKPQTGTGKWVRNQHELILLGRRGNYPTPHPGFGYSMPNSVLREPRGRHSEKPDRLQLLIERCWPDARKLELFARREREGWTAWGNEVPELAV